jgi:hypothetical protein
MPNWTDNNITFRGSPEAIQELWLIFTVNEKPFQAIRPCPEELLNPLPALNTDEEEARLVEKYGHSDWYNWRVANWGTKWDAADLDVSPIMSAWGEEKSFDITCNTAWAPPTELMCYITEKWPEIVVIGSYIQEEAPCWRNLYSAQGGIVDDLGRENIDDDYEDEEYDEPYLDDGPKASSFRAVTGTATKLPLP